MSRDASGTIAIRSIMQALGGTQRLLLLAVQARQAHAALVGVFSAVCKILDSSP